MQRSPTAPAPVESAAVVLDVGPPRKTRLRRSPPTVAPVLPRGAWTPRSQPQQSRLPPRVRIALCSDHNLLLTTLAHTLSQCEDLEPSLTWHAEADRLADGPSDTGADVILLAFVAQDSRLLGAIRAFRARNPRARLVLVANSSDPALARAAIAAGAQGYLSPSASTDQLLEAIRRVAADESFIEADLARQMAFQTTQPHERLSPRERELLLYLAEGWRSRDVARHLNLSEKTVSTFRMRLKKKLGLHTPQELTAYARSHPVL